MKLQDKLQTRTDKYEIIKHIDFNHNEGHIWEVKDRRTNEVLTLNTNQITNSRCTAANGYKRNLTVKVILASIVFGNN